MNYTENDKVTIDGLEHQRVINLGTHGEMYTFSDQVEAMEFLESIPEKRVVIRAIYCKKAQEYIEQHVLAGDASPSLMYDWGQRPWSHREKYATVREVLESIGGRSLEDWARTKTFYRIGRHDDEEECVLFDGGHIDGYTVRVLAYEDRTDPTRIAEKKKNANILRRVRSSNIEPWPCWWLDRENKTIIDPDGKKRSLESVKLSDILKLIVTGNRQRVMILGGDIAATAIQYEWMMEATSDGWSVASRHKNGKVVRCSREDVKVSLYSVSLWMSGITDIDYARKSFHAAEYAVSKKFGDTVHFISTPTMTGRQLLHTNLPSSSEIDILSDEDLQFLYTIAYQGRNESLQLPDSTMTDLYNLDGIFMYGSCCASLPTGKRKREKMPDCAPIEEDVNVPGFYNATFTVPDGWNHIGLIKESNADPDTRIRAEDGDELQKYPNTPGAQITNWVSYQELYLAHERGWNPIIHERMIWPETRKNGQPDVTANWIKKLRELRVEAKSGKYGVYSPQIADVARGLVLYTLGSFFSHTVKEMHITSKKDAATIPHLDYIPQRTSDKSGYIWRNEIDIPITMWSHPEWALTVWGRARARIARMALQLPYDDILEMKTDGIWLKNKPGAMYDQKGNPVAPEDQKAKMFTAGYWRLKDVIHLDPKWIQSSKFQVTVKNIRDRVKAEMPTDEMEDGE